MLTKEHFLMIKALATRGVYHKDSAAELGVHPKKVSRALKRHAASTCTRSARGSELDVFHSMIDALLTDGVWNAVVIFRELQAKGSTGRLTVVRDYIRPKHALRPARTTVRFETEPGQQLQRDWGEITTTLAGQATKVFFIVNQLGYLRRFPAWATDSLDAKHTYEGLIRSLEYFGGVPREVFVDNQKAAVLQHSATTVQFNPRFVDVTGQYGFTPHACRLYRARTKGKDERMVGYLKHHVLVHYRAFDSWAHLNQVLEQWLRTEANQRCQGTVKEVVAERFTREVPMLQPLPVQRYDTSYRELRQVRWDSYIKVWGNRYSVPAAYVGQTVTVRIGLDGRVVVIADDVMVAQHHLQAASADWVTVAEHHTPLWDQTMAVEQRSLAVYAEVGQWS